MHIKNKRGQSTVEYVLLVTAVLAVIIAFVLGNKSILQSQLNTSLNQAAGQMNELAGRLQDSENASAAATNTTPPYTVNVTP